MMKKVGILALASAASAHTLFTTLFVDGKNQGDGTCVRMPHDSSTATGPVYPITGDDMACGRDGHKAVAFTCPVPHNATLTFEFRMFPDASRPGVIAPEHKGPCSVYLKRVDDMYSSSADNGAAGHGWFKIWEDGYSAASGTWCVDRLIDRKGLLSVHLPAGLPAGYYLARPEILALHNAASGDPQFYTGCAQIYVLQGPEGALRIPDGLGVSIPGHVSADTPGLKFNLYGKAPPVKYPIPGPRVYMPPARPLATNQVGHVRGSVPKDCLIKNANWCAKAVPAYSTEAGCWASVKRCYSQSQACWDSAPPTGDVNCKLWQAYCKELEKQCGGGGSGNFVGPVEFKAKETMAAVPGEIPEPWNGDALAAAATTAAATTKTKTEAGPGAEETGE
ncbi:Glycoside hydrolase, family 61 [Metarhizium rileyi]|uniref:lytic cellulose monooxygenase (C4-dehydrogenating) n=1 Tax=Metarhizium rileyi (strain RCEF 4871) TaxID=1649241 RepID=A0A166VRQ5_METRR|nr:Glycoside hydrolase, family 61 [Metarhizium rileyi RCEF 4871]